MTKQPNRPKAIKNKRTNGRSKEQKDSPKFSPKARSSKTARPMSRTNKEPKALKAKGTQSHKFKTF